MNYNALQNNEILLRFIKIAHELFLFDDTTTIFGSVAHAIYSENLGFDDSEMDVMTTNPRIFRFLEEIGMRKIEDFGEINEMRKRLGYDGVNDPNQAFFYNSQNGIVIDVSLREEIPYQTNVVNINGYRLRIPTLNQLTETYEKASNRMDISEEKRDLYKRMKESLLAHA